MKLGQEKKEEKGVSSQEREETPEQDGPSQDDDDVLEDAAPVTRSEDRHGQFLIRQLPPEHQRLLHEITLSSQNVLRGDDLEGRYLGMLLMMEALNFAPFATFMELYAPSMNFEVSYDTYHEFKLSIAKALEKNKKITTDNFLDVEEPDLVDDDPEKLLFQEINGKVVLILNTRALLKVWVVRTSTLFWKQMMTNWLSVLFNGLECATRMFRRRSWKELSNKRQGRNKKKRKSRLKKNNKTLRSHMFHLEALLRKRNQFHLKALRRKRNQGKKKQTFSMMTRLPKKNLPKDFTMIRTSLETKMIQFFSN